MERLVELHHEHCRNGIAPEVSSAWLHHRFTQIHPFQDGNGRVARALATLVCIKDHLFPLVITRDHREQYINALEAADVGQLAPLTDLFFELQKKSFVQALGLSQRVLSATHTTQAMDAIEATFLEKQKQLNEDMSRVFEYADNLQGIAERKVQGLADQLTQRVGAFDPDYSFHSSYAGSENERSHWHKIQIVAAAKQLHYFAETSRHRSWVNLAIRGNNSMDIVVSIHGLGHEFNGVMVASGFSYERTPGGERGEVDTSKVTVLCEQPFQFNYLEPMSVMEPRFATWLDECYTAGLDLWRRSI